MFTDSHPTNKIRLLIESPRRSQAIPNYSGTHALFTVSSFSIDTETETTELRVIDLKSREVRLFSDDKSIQEPQWFLDTAIFWLKYADGDITEVWMGDVLSIDRRLERFFLARSYGLTHK